MPEQRADALTTKAQTFDETTISDFSDQWEIFSENDGYFSSLVYLRDITDGLIDIEDFRGKRIGEIGSGTGRWIPHLFEAGASHVLAIEPSGSFETLKRKTREFSGQMTYINEVGESIGIKEDVDIMISLGVISYIPDPIPTYNAVYEALRPGGKFLVCLMSLEGNRLYLSTFGLLRKITTRMPNRMLLLLCKFLNQCLSVYIAACKRIPLPLHDYITHVISKFSHEKRLLIIFDQLNPTYAKFYRKKEFERLFADSGFQNIELRHRHGYSWVGIGEKPKASPSRGSSWAGRSAPLRLTTGTWPCRRSAWR